MTYYSKTAYNKEEKMNIRSYIQSIKSTVMCILFVFFIGYLNILHATEATWKWPRSTPEQQGLDHDRLIRSVEIIREGQEFPATDISSGFFHRIQMGLGKN